MREILFRGKRPDGRWVYGYLSKSRDMSERPTVLMSCIDHEADGIMYSDIVLEETVGQYTGRMIHSTRLFEGDIIRRDDGMVFMVAYSTLHTTWNAYVQGSFSAFSLDVVLFRGPCKIVGNIFDDPELMQEE